MKSITWRYVGLALILSLAFGLRLHWLEERNIWWDEGWTNWLARQPLDEILRVTGNDVHPPFYYLLVHFQWLITGDGEFVLRFPSVLFGLLAVAMSFNLGKRIGGTKVGLLGAFLLGISHINIVMSQDMRMHSLALFFTTATLWATAVLWEKLTTSQKNWHWSALAYLLSVTGALYTFYLTASVLLTVNVAFGLAWLRLKCPRRLLFIWSALQIIVLAVFLPWYFYTQNQSEPPLGVEEPVSKRFLAYFYMTTLITGRGTNPRDDALLVGLASLILGLGIGLIFWRNRQKALQTSYLILLGVGFLACLGAVYWATLPSNEWARPLANRYFAHLSGPFYILLAWGLLQWRKPLHIVGGISIIAMTIIMGLGLMPYYRDRARLDDFVSVADTLAAHRQPSDEVVLYNDINWTVFSAHYSEEWLPIPHRMIMDDDNTHYTLEPVWKKAEGVWVIQTIEAQVNDSAGKVPQWFAQHALTSTSWDLGDTLLTLYIRTPERAASQQSLNPDYSEHRLPSNEIGLAGAWLPMQRYPIGETAHLWLIWETPPESEWAILLKSGDHLTRLPQEAPEIQRQQIDLLMTPDLPRGDYTITVEIDGQNLEIAQFTLMQYSYREAGEINLANVNQNLGYRLGDSITLLGYQVSANQISALDALKVDLFWQTDSVITNRYKVGVYILGESWNNARGNSLWGQSDSEPRNWQLPTSAWIPETIIADSHRLLIDDNLPNEEFQLLVGLYDLVTGERLPVYDPEGNLIGDLVPLQNLTFED